MNKTQPAFWDVPLDELMKQLGASPQGLDSDDSLERLHRNGPNILARENRLGAISALFRLLGNPLVLILTELATTASVIDFRRLHGVC
ncbi:MAG: cation-transporting P-type ATPase [Armatimonadota bacterium]